MTALIGDPRHWATTKQRSTKNEIPSRYYSPSSNDRHSFCRLLLETQRVFDALEASGIDRTFTYEVPSPGMWSWGVEAGTELFTGETDGRFYSGTARVFTPRGEREYPVSGPISNGQKRVTLYGNTGIGSLDTLVFTYVGQCRA